MAEISEQHWSARRYAETAHFVPELGAAVLGAWPPRPVPAAWVLDLACGDGVLAVSAERSNQEAASSARLAATTPPRRSSSR